MFVSFADTWESYVYTYYIKTALKEMLWKRTITQINFYVASWLGLQNFLMELYQVYQTSNIFVERIYQLKNFDMNFKGCHLGCQLELILGNW